VSSTQATPDPAATASWSLGDMIRRHAELRPDRAALVCEDRTLTFGELHHRSNRVAQGLREEGIGPQDRVAFLEQNGLEFFEILYGGGKVHAVNVAVNWRLAPSEVEFIVNDSDARILFVGEAFLPLVEEIEPNLRGVRKIVAMGEHRRYEGYEAWLARQRDVDPVLESRADDVCLQLYTSGTTGQPKGAMLTNANLATLVPMIGPMLDFGEGAVSLVCMPLFHIGGSGWALLGALSTGGTSIVARRAVPAELLDQMEAHRVSHAFFVPALMNFLNQVPGAADRDWSALEHIVYGASPITETVLKASMAIFKCRFWQVYGLTETTGAIVALPPEDHDPDGPRSHLLRSAGRPYPHVQVRIVDPATGEDLPPGSVGELWARSTQNMRGYWHRERDTETAFVGGWFRTGDVGYMDGEGYIFLTDRIKDMIVSGGENIYPIEVENVLADHPDLADVGVIGVPDEQWGETVKAVVVARPGRQPTAEQIIAFARQRLGGFKCPTSVDFVADLPRTPTGKILKRELREPYWRGRERRVN
jgi:acyl-CoA synthetase (AMP-forming)/AMP-acid ligase II